MGLDMYLNKSFYIGANYEHRKITGDIRLRKNGVKIKININSVSEIILRVGYWRKANQIHSWFVENVQNGVDDCGTYYVSRENLRELLKVVNEVIEDNVLANMLLPTKRGCFFGGTDYNKFYFDDLNYTKKMLTEILAEKDEHHLFSFTYYASW